MLKNLRVGTKLVVILVAPLVALGVLAGVGVVDRLNNAAAARRAAHIGVLANSNAEAAQAVQLEQVWAAVVLNTRGDDTKNTYRDLVSQSDATLTALQKAQSQLGSVKGDLADRLVTLRDRLTSLPKLRSSVIDRSTTAAQAFDDYHLTMDALNGVFEGATTQPVAAGIISYLNFLSTLAKGKASTTNAFTHLAGVAAAGQISSDRTDLTSAASDQSEAARRYSTFFEQADTQFKALLRNAQSSAPARSADDLAQQLLAIPPGQTRTNVDSTRFVDLATQRLQSELGVEREITKQLLAQATAAESKATSTVRLYLLGTSLGILAALGLAFLVARATVRPLRQLTDAANQLSGQQLPRLVERLRDPDADSGAVRLAPIPIQSRDEIGQLAKAFNDIQQVTTDVADEQTSLLRKGISDIFVNLARRNQALLDRQIEFIDQLESNEADPDQLDNLFRLDHLATRMRRNAESLLVLAGAEPPRRRGRPVPLADVVRVAIGEVEDFARVNLLALDDVTVMASVAVDLSHVVAELMDNATQFSPPETLVEVVGHRTRGESYVLSVSDQGIGMSSEQLTEANQQLAQPPLMGLSLGRSLGFIVISRLAARHGISVRLTSSPSDGITALVTLPSNLLGDGRAIAAESPAALAPPGRRGARPIDPVPSTDGAGEIPTPVAPPVPGQPRLPEPVLAGSVGNGQARAELPPLQLPALPGHDVTGRTFDQVITPVDPSAAPAVPHLNSSDGGEAVTQTDVGEAEQTVPQLISRLAPRHWSANLPPDLGLGRRSMRADEPENQPTVPDGRQQAEPESSGESSASAPQLDEQVRAPAGTSATVAEQVEAPAVAGSTDNGPSRRDVSHGLTLPRRTPGGDRSPTSPLPTGTPITVSSTVSSASVGHSPPADTSVDAPGEPSHPIDEASRVATVPVGAGQRGGDLTAAGLVRRSPKQQIRDLTATSGSLESARVVGSQRSPEEVRRMLSRYRTGLQRGRSGVQQGGSTSPGNDASGGRTGAEDHR
jgi:signal transduction histidine kinase